MSQPATAFWQRREAERLADLCVLGCGLVLGVCASAALLATTFAQHDPGLLIGTGIYVAGLLAMLGASLAFHGSAHGVGGSPRRRLLRRIDHAAIFAMIAGSATPFLLGRGAGVRGGTLAAAIWAVAAAGIFVKLRFPIGKASRSALFYLLLGWISLASVVPSISRETALLIAAGGAFYTIGIVFYLWRRLPFHSAIWHTFVLAGAACHYLAILGAIVSA